MRRRKSMLPVALKTLYLKLHSAFIYLILFDLDSLRYHFLLPRYINCF
jgi:hypothetical protein